MKNKIFQKPLKPAWKLLLTVLAILFWIGVWWIAAENVEDAWILPTPAAAFSALWEGIREASLLKAVASSLLGVFKGFLAATLLGIVLAAVTSKIQLLHILFSPLLTVVKATPIASFILILWVFVDRSTVPAISVMLIVLPIIWANTETGISGTDRALAEMGRAYGFNRFKTVRYIYLPAAYPYFKTGAITGIGMAWKAGIAAEVLCTPKGTVGTMIYYAKRDMQTAELFAWTFSVVAVCFLVEKLLAALLNLPYKRKKI